MIPCIKNALESDTGALIGRNGTIELEQMIEVTPERLSILERNAGIFPVAVHSIFYRWQKAMGLKFCRQILIKVRLILGWRFWGRA